MLVVLFGNQPGFGLDFFFQILHFLFASMEHKEAWHLKVGNCVLHEHAAGF